MITTSDGEIYEDETAHALGVKKDVKPVIDKSSGDDVVTLAMNMENIQPSKHTQIRGVIADALAKFSLTLPRVDQKNTDPINVGEGVIHKENSISQSLSQSIGHAGDRAYGRSEKKEFDALDYQKRLDDWVTNGKDNDPLPDPF